MNVLLTISIYLILAFAVFKTLSYIIRNGIPKFSSKGLTYIATFSAGIGIILVVIYLYVIK